jgi:hypothetical protein
MVHTRAISLRQNRRWAWGVLGGMVMLLVIPLNQTTWEAGVFSVGLIAVLVWVMWPMLPDWRFDGVGVWRGRTCVAAWSDVQSVDVRSYAHAARQLGSIDVVMRTPTQVIRLRLYCRVEAAQLMQVLEHFLPAECDRTPIINAVARAWPKRRHE